MDKAIILGAGNYGQVYSEYIKEQKKFEIVGFLDDTTDKIGKTFYGIEVLGPIGDLEILKDLKINSIFAPIGNNEVRVKWLRKAEYLGYNTPSFFHKNTSIHSSVKLGKAVYVLPNSSIMPFASLSNYVMISMGVNIGHHSRLAEGCFVSSGSTIGGTIDIEEKAFIGIGSTVMTGVEKIGKNTTIGAGSVVIRDVPDNAVVAGNPAKILRYNLPE